MTNPSPGPSLVQARDTNTLSNPDTASHSHPHSLTHRLDDKSPHSLQHLQHHHHHNNHHSHYHNLRDIHDESALHHQGGTISSLAHADAPPDEVRHLDHLPASPAAQPLVEPHDPAVDASHDLHHLPDSLPDSPGEALPPDTVAISAHSSHATLAPPGSARDASGRITSSYDLSAGRPANISPAYTNSSSSSSSSSPGSSENSSSWSSQASDASASDASVYPTLNDVRNGTNTVASIAEGNSAPTNSAPTTNSTALTANRNVVESAPTLLSHSTSSGITVSSPAASTVNSNITSQSTALSASSPCLTSTSSAAHLPTWTDAASSTMADGFATGTAAETPTLTASRTAGADSETPISLEQKRVIGGIVGSVAGAMFIMALIFLLFRYKKRKQDQSLLGGSMPTTASPSGVGGNPGPVSDRSGVAAATFDKLRGKRPPPGSAANTPSAEGSFYRISGKKLPPVLMAGGDGYSDPRPCGVSGQSDLYPGSQALGPDAQGQLALGVPMRPVSGVPILRLGPARTPVTENPFANPFADPPASPVIYDSPASPPGSRGSRSRFLERL